MKQNLVGANRKYFIYLGKNNSSKKPNEEKISNILHKTKKKCSQPKGIRHKRKKKLIIFEFEKETREKETEKRPQKQTKRCDIFLFSFSSLYFFFFIYCFKKIIMLCPIKLFI